MVGRRGAPWVAWVLGRLLGIRPLWTLSPKPWSESWAPSRIPEMARSILGAMRFCDVTYLRGYARQPGLYEDDCSVV